MNIPFIVTLVGEDRPGLVNALAERAAANGANWLDSSMAHLAGKFAGIVLVTVPEDQADALRAARDQHGQSARPAQGVPQAL